MAEGFSIDDVRESFAADVGAFIERIEQASKILQELPLPDAKNELGKPLFQAVSEHGHAILGTSGLVSARSLASSAELLERIGELGQQAVLEAHAHLARARQLAALAGDGARAMRRMLELELQKNGAEAGVYAEEFKQQVQSAEPQAIPKLQAGEIDFSASTPNTGTSKSGVELSFDDPAAGGQSSGQMEGDELIAIFQAEARELLVALQGYLQALAARPRDLAVVGHIERIYHTLKGAAATVGMQPTSELAAALQFKMEKVADEGGSVTKKLMKELVKETNELLLSAGLTEIDVPDGKPVIADPEVRAAFMNEAQGFLEEALSLIRQLGDTSHQKKRDTLDELGKLFHRIKGSAMIHEDRSIADEASRLQALCQGESPEPPTVASLTQGIQRIATVLDLPLSDRLHEAERLASFHEPINTGRSVEGVAVRQAVQLMAEPELWDAFELECSEILEQLDGGVSRLEDAQEPKSALAELMRLVHTLKGSVNTIGMSPTGALLHRVEDFLEGLLDAPILPSLRYVAGFMLKVQEQVRRHLSTSRRGYVDLALADIESDIKGLLEQGRLTTEPRRRIKAPSSAGSEPSRRSVATADPGSAERSATDDAETTVEQRYLRIKTERLDSLMNLAGELVVSRSRLLSRVTAMRSVRQDLRISKNRLVGVVESFREEYEFSGVDGRGGNKKQAPAKTAVWEGFGELELDRYEDVNVLARRLAEISNDLNELHGQLFTELSSFAADSDAFSSIVSGIQNEVTRARMTPVDALFTRLRLAVRDAAEREGKNVRVVTTGEGVNLDKTIVDALYTPMLHLVRNAVTHGIEDAARREAAGKPAVGTVTMTARQEAGQIVIEVADDGAGLDRGALHARGVAMGLIRPETPLGDPAVAELVFAAGLSTRTTTSSVSGRGVGANVVRRAVERLNGEVRVQGGVGRGTTFLVTLPVTLAITRALLVRHRKELYLVPLYFAERIIQTEGAVISDSAGVRRLLVEDQYVSLRGLGELLGTARPEDDTGPLLVLRVGDQRAALQVSAVLGQEETVVKNLGDVLAGHPLFAGVTIRGTGELALILDVPSILDMTTRHVEGPLEMPDPDLLPEPSNRPPVLLDADMAPPSAVRVLFVDDSLSVRKVAERFLTGLGANVTLAVDGVDGLAKLRAGRFDLVLTDLEMPRLHGYELIREIRYIPAYRDLPVVVVTSRSGQRHREQARAVGASDYVTKPFSAETFQELLGKWSGAGPTEPEDDDPESKG